MTKVFITGESGVIPQAIAALAKTFDIEIVNSQLNETAVDHLKTYQAFKIRKAEIDFTNKENLEKAIEITKPEIIIHSGAFVGTDYCLSSQEEAVKANVTGTQNVVDVCNKYNISLIYFSTTAIFDPKEYGRFKPITEKTPIDPQTLYGITKYAGELIVKNLCKTDKMIVRPVFGFGDYPHDLHSALTKLCYTIFGDQENKLTILLDEHIGKNYYRVENIAYCILRLINHSCWNLEVNVGEHFSQRLNWHEICYKLCEYNIELFKRKIENVTFVKKSDYLQWHNIDNERLISLIGDDIHKISFDDGLRRTIKSVIENKNTIPYWI